MAESRRRFVGGNWKCKGFQNDLVALAKGFSAFHGLEAVDVVVAPTPIYLSAIKEAAQNNLQVSSQNVSATSLGAYTGEIAAEQLVDMGINWTIIGHSERRTYYGDTNDVVKTKVGVALGQNLKVIACFGETLDQREAGKTMDVNFGQLKAIAAGVPEGKWGDVVLAYEPVWAIGTGKTCPSEEAENVICQLRGWLSNNVSADVASATRIIYGGSVKPKNCVELMGKPNIDGFLVGGASLKVETFEPIVKSALGLRAAM